MLVGQAVRARLRGKQQLEDFIEAIRSGEQDIQDADEQEGRDKSLGASLSYGFRNAFTDEELSIIALLHLFQGNVHVNALVIMGRSRHTELPEVKVKTQEGLTRLLKRARDIGVVTQIGETNYFAIHPALPWFLRQIFFKHYDGKEGRSTAETALRSWVETMGAVGSYYVTLFQRGERDAIMPLVLHELNFLHGRRLARKNGWVDLVVPCMQGLHMLYDYQGRLAEWSRLVEEVRLDYSTVNNEPIPGTGDDRIYDHMVVMAYMVSLASKYEYNFPKAIALQEKLVKTSERIAAVAMSAPSDAPLTVVQRQELTNLSGSLSRLGDFRAEVDNAQCVVDYQKAIAIFRRAGETAGEAMVEWNLGNAYQNLSEIRDFDAAEAAYRRSLDLLAPSDKWGRSKCFRQMGLLYSEKLSHAIDRNESSEIALKYAQMSEQHCRSALSLCPEEALNELSSIHYVLGDLYLTCNLVDSARGQFELAAQLEEQMGNRLNAGTARYHIAITYVRAASTEQQSSQQRANLERARAYAEAALRDYKYYGENAAPQVQGATELLNGINKAISELGQ